LFTPFLTNGTIQLTYAAEEKKEPGSGAIEEKEAGTGDNQKKPVPTKGGPCGDKICNPLGKGANLDSIIKKILSGINVVAAMVVTFFIILGGFKYVTAMGDEKKITDAHNMLKWTVIGAAILFGAQVIANIIQTTVTELSKVK
jgi:hypothetical protein